MSVKNSSSKSLGTEDETYVEGDSVYSYEAKLSLTEVLKNKMNKHLHKKKHSSARSHTSHTSSNLDSIDLLQELRQSRTQARLLSDNRTEFGSFRSLDLSPTNIQRPHSRSLRFDSTASKSSFNSFFGKNKHSSKNIQKTLVNLKIPKAEERQQGNNAADYLFGQLLGEGSYARVHVCMPKVRLNTSANFAQHCFAVKVMEKRFISKERKAHLVQRERDCLSILSSTTNAFVVKFFAAFRDNRYLYLVLELCPFGTLRDLILTHHQRQDIESTLNWSHLTRFYFAELVAGVQFIHSQGIIHRDLKCENILVSSTAHLKLCDFGSAKLERKPLSPSKASSVTAVEEDFVGSEEYVCPEMLEEDDTVSVGADLWALGIVLYFFYSCKTPFKGETELETFENITSHNDERTIIFEKVRDLEAESLVNALCRRKALNRIGCNGNSSHYGEKLTLDALNETNGPDKLRGHTFFRDITWEDVGLNQAPDIPDEIIEEHILLEPKFDGAKSDWLLYGDATDLEYSFQKGVSMEEESLINTERTQSVTKSVTKNKPIEKTKGVVEQHLRNNESIVLQAPVKKRKGLFTHNRLLVFTNAARFLYFATPTPDRVDLKGEIEYEEALKVVAKPDNKKFEILTGPAGGYRTYQFVDLSGNARRWESMFLNEKAKLLESKAGHHDMLF